MNIILSPSDRKILDNFLDIEGWTYMGRKEGKRVPYLHAMDDLVNFIAALVKENLRTELAKTVADGTRGMTRGQ